MTFGLLFQPVDPFPPPEHAGQEIENVGLMFALIIFLLFFVLLMLYLWKHNGVATRPERWVPVFIVWFSSMILALRVMANPFFPFSPSFEIFFILFQTIIFALVSLELYNEKNPKNRRK